jgi:hypothetical protein
MHSVVNKRKNMKIKAISVLFIIIFISVISLGCQENNNELSSDFTPLAKETVSQVNDSNIGFIHL